MALPEYEFPVSYSAPQETYQQQTFDAFETKEPTPLTIDNCVVMSWPTYIHQNDTSLWKCSLAAEPDIFHPDQHELVEAQATTYAQIAQKTHIKPGDRVIVTGIAHKQELELANGERRTIQHLMVSDIKVIERAKRMSITVYERKRL